MIDVGDKIQIDGEFAVIEKMYEETRVVLRKPDGSIVTKPLLSLISNMMRQVRKPNKK